MTTDNPAVLFLCVHNAGRSQMAAGLLRLATGGSIIVSSAGSEPADALNPAVVAAMEEIGVDITDRAPTKLTDVMIQSVDVVVTMGCGDACPVYAGKRYLDWEVEDPAGQPIEVVRTIRDDIAARVNRLIDELLDERV
jgi:arsenate reductase